MGDDLPQSLWSFVEVLQPPLEIKYRATTGKHILSRVSYVRILGQRALRERA